MNPLQLILLGLGAGLACGVVVFAGVALFGPRARAPRVALAGMIGGTIGFSLTALVQGPFYHGAKTPADMAEPMSLALLVAAGAAGLCAAMILRAAR